VNVVRLKFVARFAYGDALSSEKRIDGGVPVFGSNGTVGTHSRANTLAPAIVVGRKGSFGKLAYSEGAGFCIDTTYFIDRRLSHAHLRWLYYALQTVGLDDLSQDTGVPGLSREAAYEKAVFVPAPPMQLVIATFLDRKTAAIDALIAKKERLIALLQEKRQALITQAVTKGLDPSVPMKESGVEWIGRVPSHWRRTRLGYLSMIGNGSTPSREEPSYWAEKGFPWLNSAKVNDETVPQADRFVTPRAMQECHLPRVNPGTVLMAITGEGQTRGRAAVLTFEATVSQHIAYIAPSAQIIPRFLLRQLQARYLWLRQESSGGGSTKGALTCEFLRTVPITLPPIAEQDAIVARMDRVLAHQGHVVDLLSGSVEKLREYRQALITAAVTGKIDVSTEAA